MQNSCLINLRSPGCTKPTFIPVRTFLGLLCHHLSMSLVSSKQENRNHSISDSKSLILGNGYRGSGTAQGYPGMCKMLCSLRAGTGLHFPRCCWRLWLLLLLVSWNALTLPGRSPGMHSSSCSCCGLWWWCLPFSYLHLLELPLQSQDPFTL